MVVKHTVTLEIAGTKFRLIADADEQHLAELASMVNDRVAKLGGSGRATAAQVLGLRKIRHTVTLADTPETRGMLHKVRHLVTVE